MQGENNLMFKHKFYSADKTRLHFAGQMIFVYLPKINFTKTV